VKRSILSIFIVISIVIGMLGFVGCTPNRTTMADIVRYYGASAEYGFLLEWNNITPVDDEELIEISKDLSSLAKGILVYIPSYGLIGTMLNPKSLWRDLLIVIDTPSNLDDKVFAQKLSDFMSKWFDIEPQVSAKDGRTYIEFMDTKLYVYTIGGMKVLSGTSTLDKNKEPASYVDRVLTSMLSLEGDYRTALFYRDIYGILSFTGGSNKVVGKFSLGTSLKKGLDGEKLFQYSFVGRDDSRFFVAVDGKLISAVYNVIEEVTQSIVKSVSVPHDMQLAVVGMKDGTGEKDVLISISGITPEELIDLVSKLDGIYISDIEKIVWRDGVTIYKIDRDFLAFKDGTIYIFPNVSFDRADSLLKSFFTDENKDHAATYRDLIDRDDLHMIGFYKIDDVPKELEGNAPGEISIKVYGSDVLTLEFVMDKPMVLKNVIYRYMRNFKELTVGASMRRDVEDAKFRLFGIVMSANIFYEDRGRIPKDKEELISSLDSFVRDIEWLDGRNIVDVIRDVNTLYIVQDEQALLCIPVPDNYLKYTGGKYAVVPIGQFDKESLAEGPPSLVVFRDTCEK